jgi:hypothetical protein
MPRYATWLKLPGGGFAIVHTSKPAKACATCQERFAAFQCDFPIAPGKTCDKYLCSDCKVSEGAGFDYCPEHPRPPTPDMGRMG